MARRCAFAVFNAVYRFIETAGRRDFDIWPSVGRELRIAIALAPLMFASLSASWFSQVLATDAAESGQGVVASEHVASDIECMSRAPIPIVTLEHAEMDRSLHPKLQGAQWKTIVSSRFTYPEHINVLELEALMMASAGQYRLRRAKVAAY